MTTHLVIPDGHAHFKHHNKRAEYVGGLIASFKPDVVIDLGDTADFPSLSSYDKGKKSFHGRSYAADVDAHNDYQDRLWHASRKSKRKLPLRIRLIGNHEQRIDRVLELQPELEGTIGYDDLELEKYYDIIVPYNGNTPGVIEIDGIQYAHYFTSGVLGKPIGGIHAAYSLVQKRHVSSTQGHSHTYDYKIAAAGNGRSLHGLVAGCYIDYDTGWAGEAEKFWRAGVAIKHNVNEGDYDLEWVGLERLKKEYA